MPMLKPEDFGTASDGWRQNEYCRYCFADGRFLQPNVTVDQMIEFVAKPMAEATGLSEDAARAAARDFLPHLARWEQPAA